MGIKTRGKIELGNGVTIEYDRGTGELKITKDGTDQLGLSSTETIATKDTNSNLGAVKTTALHIGTSGSETEVTATAAELNKLAGAGTAVASGTQAAKINDPAGGATVDAEARTAINAIIDALEAFGISASA